MRLFTRSPLDGLAAHDDVVRTARSRALRVDSTRRNAYADNCLSTLNHALYNLDRADSAETVAEVYHQARTLLGIAEAMMVGSDQRV